MKQEEGFDEDEDGGQNGSGNGVRNGGGVMVAIEMFGGGCGIWWLLHDCF